MVSKVIRKLFKKKTKTYISKHQTDEDWLKWLEATNLIRIIVETVKIMLNPTKKITAIQVFTVSKKGMNYLTYHSVIKHRDGKTIIYRLGDFQCLCLSTRCFGIFQLCPQLGRHTRRPWATLVLRWSTCYAGQPSRRPVSSLFRAFCQYWRSQLQNKFDKFIGEEKFDKNLINSAEFTVTMGVKLGVGNTKLFLFVACVNQEYHMGRMFVMNWHHRVAGCDQLVVSSNWYVLVQHFLEPINDVLEIKGARSLWYPKEDDQKMHVQAIMFSIKSIQVQKSSHKICVLKKERIMLSLKSYH